MRKLLCVFVGIAGPLAIFKLWVASDFATMVYVSVLAAGGIIQYIIDNWDRHD